LEDIGTRRDKAGVSDPIQSAILSAVHEHGRVASSSHSVIAESSVGYGALAIHGSHVLPGGQFSDFLKHDLGASSLRAGSEHAVSTGSSAWPGHSVAESQALAGGVATLGTHDVHSAVGAGANASSSAVRDYEYLLRSPYAQECPASSPMGLSVVARGGDPGTSGDAGATLTQTPKVGCKCLAMQRQDQPREAAESSGELRVDTAAALAARLGMQHPGSATAAELALVDALIETGEGSRTESPCCSREADVVDEAIEVIQTDGQQDPEPEAHATSVMTWREAAVLTGLSLAYLGAYSFRSRRNRLHDADTISRAPESSN
jgi:hypothetical protein